MYQYGKRIFDLTVSAVLLVAASPVLLATAVVIKATSPGPVLYKGVRVGLDGRKFCILKFRTMVVGAEAAGTTTSLNDPRVTRFGAVLRRKKLDELPQLVNVLRGQMSLVGPRPEVEEHTGAYSDEELAILSVLPGITDYSSVHFSRLDRVLGADNAHEVYLSLIRAEKNALRLQYVREQSFVVDLRILCLTILTLVRPASVRI